ncbi:MAG: hypothetical protein ACJ8BC_01540 [Gemmatimonadales bacterium]
MPRGDFSPVSQEEALSYGAAFIVGGNGASEIPTLIPNAAARQPAVQVHTG